MDYQAGVSTVKKLNQTMEKIGSFYKQEIHTFEDLYDLVRFRAKETIRDKKRRQIRERGRIFNEEYCENFQE